jgi:hypothetical protein
MAGYIEQYLHSTLEPIQFQYKMDVTNKSTCSARGCLEPKPKSNPFCKHHWEALPEQKRESIVAGYQAMRRHLCNRAWQESVVSAINWLDADSPWH